MIATIVYTVFICFVLMTGVSVFILIFSSFQSALPKKKVAKSKEIEPESNSNSNSNSKHRNIYDPVEKPW